MNQRTNDKYNIVSYLGRGSFGEIFYATRCSDSLDCVLKRVSKDMIKRTTMNIDVFKELKILSILNHPNIVKIYDGFETTKNYCLIFEYCNSGDLRALMRKTLFSGKCFSEDFIRSVIRSVSHALIFANENIENNYLLHRDVKPDNIFIHDSVIKLGDFGQARIYDPLFSINLSTEQGTVIYMSPEMFTTEYDSRTDVWSLGAVAYELAFNKTILIGRGIYEIHKELKKFTLDFPAIPERSEELKDLISKMLVLDYKKRYHFSQVVDHPFIKNN